MHSVDKLKQRILTIRGQQVLIDRDLADLYQVGTKVLNQAVKRNSERFPLDFIFQLTLNEKNEVVTNCDHLKNLRFSPNLPLAFTEQGVANLSSVLKSDKAIRVNIQIMRTFVAMRRFLTSNGQIFARIDSKLLEHDEKFDQVFKAIESKRLIPSKGIFFDGQIFDAYKFISDLIRSADKSIILIDNYVDDTALTLFRKRKKDVTVKIYSGNSKITKQDIEKYNKQYPPIELIKFNKSHDRFLIVDDKVYHIGASLKDLGKKWFAFSRLDEKIINRLLVIDNI